MVIAAELRLRSQTETAILHLEAIHKISPEALIPKADLTHPVKVTNAPVIPLATTLTEAAEAVCRLVADTDHLAVAVAEDRLVAEDKISYLELTKT
jgi:hypothetical protein